MQYPEGFYAYLWLRPDGTPYYAGKGSGNRGFERSGHIVNPPKDKSRIIILVRSSEQAALDTEMELIRNWGRKDIGTGCLRNRTSGGEKYKRGPWTPERRAAQAERIRKQGLGGWNKGIPNPEFADRLKGNTWTRGKHTHSAEGNRRISAAKKGIPLSAEHCRNLSIAHKGKPWSAARRAAQEKRSTS